MSAAAPPVRDSHAEERGLAAMTKERRGKDGPTMRAVQEETKDEARLRERAGALLQKALDFRHLPDFLPGEPSGMAGASAATAIAPLLLDDLAALYRVRRWTPEEFVRAYVEGALAAWQPGLQVERRPSGLRLVSPVCPIAAEADLDPRACRMCQALQAEAARRAAGADAEHAELITRGDAACVTDVRFPRPIKG